LAEVSKNPKKLSGLGRIAALGVTIAIVSGTGLVLVTKAQDAGKSTAEVPATQATSADITPANPTPGGPIAYDRYKAQAATGSDAAAEAPAQTVAKPIARQAFRGDTQFGRPILLRRPLPPAKVQWAGAMNQANKMRPSRKTGGFATRLPRPELDATRLPVILPRDGGMIDTTQAKLVTFGDAYALNLPQKNGMQITSYGNRSFVPAEGGSVSKRPVARLLSVAEDIRISQMEDGWTATFTRYGVVYSIDVSCDDINAPDCQNDTFIRQAVAQFDDVTMGSQAQAQAEANAVVPAANPNLIDQVSNAFNRMTKGN